MDGLMAPLLKTAIKAYLKDRLGDRFEAEDYDRLAEEFTLETTRDEFTALRKLNGDDRRDLIREITGRIKARIEKTGSREEQRMMKRFAKARAETSTSGPAKKATNRKKR